MEKKPAAAIIVEMMGKGKDEESEEDEDLAFAQEILDAVKNDDPEALLMAIKDLFHSCASEYE